MKGQLTRTQKAFLNAKISMICYFVGLITTFFTRKIFLDYLGDAFIGLSGTLQSLLGFLNLAELGVSAAIAFVLYRPIFDSDRDKIKEIIAVLGFLYRCIGYFILGGGIVLSLFLPLIFKDITIDLGVVYFGFYAYLCSSLLGYLVNYRSALLSADQKNYLVTGYYQLTSSIKAIVQMGLAFYLQNFYLFLSIELIFAVVNSVILNWKINKTYPWLKLKEYNGRKLLKNHPVIGVKIRQLIIHRIGSFIQFQIMPFFVYSYVSLPMVALYGNYSMISQRIEGFLNSLSTGLYAGVGNLIAEGNKDKIICLYKELMVSRIAISAVISVCLCNLLSPLVIVWLGPSYELDQTFVTLLSIASFLNLCRSTTDQFVSGFGLFGDVWAPFAEASIYIVSALILGPIWGLNGLILAPILSLGIIIYIWKPFWLFSRGFNIPVFKYWEWFLSYMLPVVALFYCIPIICCSVISENDISQSWMNLIKGCILYFCVSCVSIGLTLSVLFKSMRAFLSRFFRK